MSFGAAATRVQQVGLPDLVAMLISYPYQRLPYDQLRRFP
jgi:hypothetical protein